MQTNLGVFDRDLVWKFKKSDKGQHQISLRFWYRKYPYKIKTWCMQFPISYLIHKTTWPWISLKVPKCQTKVNDKLILDFDVENIPLMLQTWYRYFIKLLCSQCVARYVHPTYCENIIIIERAVNIISYIFEWFENSH